MTNKRSYPKTGAYKAHLDSKIENTATDIYYQTEKRRKDSNLSTPSKDAVEKAKDWVDNINKM